jgi:uncharacterized membrane protein YphA (DoxX/SURF4 family)
MTAMETRAVPPTTRGRAITITLWVLQVLLAVFFLVAAAGPKLLGQQYAVEMFDQIGAGQWLRYLVGALEFAGAIGLLIPRLAGLAALGLAGVMVGAALTQVFILDSAVVALTPAALVAVFGLIAWGRWPQTRDLMGNLKR